MCCPPPAPTSEESREIAPFLDDIRDHEHGKVLRAIIDSAHHITGPSRGG